MRSTRAAGVELPRAAIELIPEVDVVGRVAGQQPGRTQQALDIGLDRRKQRGGALVSSLVSLFCSRRADRSPAGRCASRRRCVPTNGSCPARISAPSMMVWVFCSNVRISLMAELTSPSSADGVGPAAVVAPRSCGSPPPWAESLRPCPGRLAAILLEVHRAVGRATASADRSQRARSWQRRSRRRIEIDRALTGLDLARSRRLSGREARSAPVT